MNSSISDIVRSIEPADKGFRERARGRLGRLTMPFWAMGRVLDLAEDLAAMTRSMTPAVERGTVVLMAGDHGVGAEGVSKYPREVTVQMVRNFIAGGAGINAVAKAAGASVVVVDMGVDGDLHDLDGRPDFYGRKIARGTANMAKGPAMSRMQAEAAIVAGMEIARALSPGTDVFATGDMGIGNTTPSAALGILWTGADAADMAGRGTGLDDKSLDRKVEVIRRSLEKNRPDPEDPLEALSKVGGFEIAGLAGLILGAAAQRKPVLVDGFISTAAALAAWKLCPASVDYMIASHKSEEKGHGLMLKALGKKALLDLGLRLGEGTGAALAMPILKAAVRVLSDVATFNEAGVSTADK